MLGGPMPQLLISARERWLVILAILEYLVSLRPFVRLSEAVRISATLQAPLPLGNVFRTIVRPLVPILLVLHYGLDGFRWQLYPVYLHMICLTLSYTSTAAAGKAAAILPFIRFPCLLFATAVCFFFPLPMFPEPEGTWGCGIEEFQFSVNPGDLISAISRWPTSSGWYAPADSIAGQHHQQVGSGSSSSSSNTSVRSSTVNAALPSFAGRTSTGVSTANDSSTTLLQALVYYPIESHRYRNEGRYRWFPYGKRSLSIVAAALGLPRFLFRYLLAIRTHSIMMAPLSKKRRRYPIAFLSHGVAMTKTSHSVFCQSLASQGYLVVALEHCDGTALVTSSSSVSAASCPEPLRQFFGSISVMKRSVLPPEEMTRRRPKRTAVAPSAAGSVTSPGGTTSRSAHRSTPTDALNLEIGKDLRALVDLLESADPSSAAGSSSPLYPTPADEAQQRSSYEDSHLEYRHEQLLVRVAEIRAAYEAMAQMSETSGCWIKDRVDWESSAIIGFGFGGAAALLTCIVEHFIRLEAPQLGSTAGSNFRCCVLLNPWLDAIYESELKLANWAVALGVQAPARIVSQLPQSFLLVTSAEQNCNRHLSNQIRLVNLMRDSSAESTLLSISRSHSLDFTDVPLLSPWVFAWLGLSGPRHPLNSGLMVNRIVFNFLNFFYRRSLFGAASSRKNGPRMPRHRGRVRRPGSGSSATQESDAAACCLQSVSDASSSSGMPVAAICRGDTALSAEAAGLSSSGGVPVDVQQNIRWAPSTLQALRMVGVSTQYIRGLSGLRSSTSSGLRLLLAPGEAASQTNHTRYDILEGVAQFLDATDKCNATRGAARSGTGGVAPGCASFGLGPATGSRPAPISGPVSPSSSAAAYFPASLRAAATALPFSVGGSASTTTAESLRFAIEVCHI